MKLLVTVALALAIVPAALSGEKDFTTNSLPIPGHASLQIIAPKEWIFVAKGRQLPSQSVPRTAELSAKDAGAKLLLTAFWDGFGGDKKLTPALYQTHLRASLEAQYAPSSVEKKTVVEKFGGTNVQGWFARFTDAKWSDKTPPAGEYANIATGWFHCGDLWGHFTLFTNEKDGPLIRQGLAVMEGLKRGPNQP